MTLRISLARAGAMLAGMVTLLAQPWTGGTGYGGGAATGLGGGYGGPTLARVNVAPLAGGGQTVGLGAGGFGAPAAGAGGLFGVTRPTFMGEANAVAGQFFSNAGVPLAGVASSVRAPTVPLPAYAGQVRATPGAYAVRTRMPASPAPALSRAEVGASLATTSAAPEPAPTLAFSPTGSPGSALQPRPGPSGIRPELTGPGRAVRAIAEPPRPRQRMVR
jgi:hypothetical protein